MLKLLNKSFKIENYKYVKSSLFVVRRKKKDPQCYITDANEVNMS